MIVLNDRTGGSNSRPVRMDEEIQEVTNFGNVRPTFSVQPEVETEVVKPTSEPEQIDLSITPDNTKKITRWALLGGVVIVGLLAFREG